MDKNEHTLKFMYGIDLSDKFYETFQTIAEPMGFTHMKILGITSNWMIDIALKHDNHPVIRFALTQEMPADCDEAVLRATLRGLLHETIDP